MPEASGIDVICMTQSDFTSGRLLIDHLAHTIVREGRPIMAHAPVGSGPDHEPAPVNWDDVDRKITNAAGAAAWITAIQTAGIIDASDDLQFARLAQDALALAFAYQGALGAHGCEYPVSGLGARHLSILADLIRKHRIIGTHDLAPGERHRYRSEYGGPAGHADRHPPIDRRLIADEIPDAVAQLRAMTAHARDI